MAVTAVYGNTFHSVDSSENQNSTKKVDLSHSDYDGTRNFLSSFVRHLDPAGVKNTLRNNPSQELKNQLFLGCFTDKSYRDILQAIYKNGISQETLEEAKKKWADKPEMLKELGIE